MLGAAAIGVGGMVGGGIFAVLGTAVDLAGGGTPVAFIVAGIIALLTAYSYVRFSVTFPSQGGTVLFVDRAFGVNLLTGVIDLILYLGYVITIGLYASAFGSYAGTFFSSGAPWLNHLLISVAIIAPMFLNLLSVELVSRMETGIVVIKLLLLAAVLVFAFPSVDLSAMKLARWGQPSTLIAGALVIFVAYEGFELIANASDDIIEPKKNLPRAYYLAVGSVVVLYVLVAIVTVGSLSSDEIKASEDFALAAAAKPAMGKIGFTLVAVSAMLATLSAINATIYGNARLGFKLACDGELPPLLTKKIWQRPFGGVLVTGSISLLLANFIDLEAIAMGGTL
jgi:amino acid transporter